MVRFDDRRFAGTDAGLYRSDDEGESWSPAGQADRKVWQVRGAGTNGAGESPGALVVLYAMSTAANGCRNPVQL